MMESGRANALGVDATLAEVALEDTDSADEDEDDEDE